ncbi:outer membrane efflux protein [Novosphingobium sp. Rr 2-17]|uniref:TolC family protein n=1 Tax=Novosphingobium sp. Rr 2-17 TaxID=555793 RepID=UPI0002699F42|nr:TolC family protein [Novosphingobium sp. Rr 2-17]EIZ77355.1 outer membrane efflux protein [Novosphingobium sp. Rr 2-17]
MKPIFAALLAATACVPFAAQAQEAALTLDRALALAGVAAPSLEAASANVRAAGAATTVAGLRPNPEVQAMTENVAGSGVYRGLNSAETTVQLALPLELGGKRPARIAYARAEQDRARLAEAVARADLRLAITQGYITATAAEQRLANARRQAGIAADALHAAQVRVRAGRASPLEEQRAQVLQVNADASVDKAARLLNLARANLARRIGQPVTTVDLTWFDRIGAAGPAEPVDPAGTLALAAAQAGVVSASAQVGLARAQRVPDVTVAAGVRRLSASNDVAAVFSLTMPLPVFNGGGAALEQASAQHVRAQALARAEALDIAQDLATAEAEVANAEVSARTAAGPAIAAAEEAARIARIGYREGKFGQLDLIEAERTLAQTRAEAIDALAAFHDAQARRDRLAAPVPAALDD